MAQIGYTPRPYHIYEQIHDVLITNSQIYSIIRISMLCPSGIIMLDDRLALPSECFVSMTFFSFGLLLCIIFEESLFHHVDPYQFHIQSLLNSVITFSIHRSASSNHSLLIQILSFFFFQSKSLLFIPEFSKINFQMPFLPREYDAKLT